MLCNINLISKKSRSFLQDNVFLGTMLKHIINGLLENAAMSGQCDLNPFYFHYQEVIFLCLYMVGQPILSKPLIPDIIERSYARAYHRLLSRFTDNGYVSFIQDL